MTWVSTVAGALLVLVGLRDIFSTLWHPRGMGTVCRLLFRALWKVTKPFNRGSRSTELAGPLGMLATAVVWTALVVVGCALIYLPHMPGAFYLGSSLQPAESSDLVRSLYLSLVTVATLGFGDILPAHAPLRFLVPAQALIGFVLLTAVISWILQVYPALVRRRALATRLQIMADTEATTVVENGDASVASSLLDTVTEGLSTVEMDLTQYGESYYFRESNPDLSLAAALPYTRRLIEAGGRSQAMEVRHAAAMLERATHSLAGRLDEEYLRCGGSIDAVLEAFAADHQQPVTGG